MKKSSIERWTAWGNALDGIVRFAFPNATDLELFHASVSLDKYTGVPLEVRLNGKVVILAEQSQMPKGLERSLKAARDVANNIMQHKIKLAMQAIANHTL